ncbi:MULTISPECIES: AMP-binding protein [unclassified Variovorax]|uniref:AMP-binding protein n=2 Tax=Variovorax TaxID=34072 RepID=UPI003F48A40E
MNLFTLLAHAARRFPAHGAVFHGERLVQRYGDLHRRALELAAGLRGLGLSGERVAIVTENCPQYVELLFGIWAAEAVAVPVNAKLHPREMVQIVEDAGARLVIASAKLATSAGVDASAACKVITIGTDAYEALFCEPAPAPVNTAADALAWLFYTSGTTGRSKGAMLSHRNLMAMTVAHLADIDGIEDGDSQVHAAPMSHGSGLYIPAYIARGAKQVIPPSGGFDPGEFIGLCNAHTRCGAFLAPTMVQRLRLEAERSGARPAHLRTIVYGGGPMYGEELRKSIAVFGQVFVQIYGQGESPMTIAWLSRRDHEVDDPAILGSVGQARTGLGVRVVDAQGRDLPCGDIGEIVCRGDTVMRGYWNNPAATAEALERGWLRTGDMGSLDAHGYLTLRDRSKDVIISGGSNIYPREVEEVLLLLPGVVEACVVGQRDEEWGEIVVAYIVAKPDVTPQVLDAHCVAHIARFKRPKHYVFVPELPKNSYGKVLKRELRQP